MDGATVATSLDHRGRRIGQALRSPPRNVPAVLGERADMSFLMRNEVHFSDCGAPTIPVAAGRVGLIRVEIEGDLLTIADIWRQTHGSDGNMAERIGARIYARRMVALDGADAFMILAALPDGIDDDKFFPATGVAVLFDANDSGPRVLKACGMDENSGSCQGWIFEAVEA